MKIRTELRPLLALLAVNFLIYFMDLSMGPASMKGMLITRSFSFSFLLLAILAVKFFPSDDWNKTWLVASLVSFGLSQITASILLGGYSSQYHAGLMLIMILIPVLGHPEIWLVFTANLTLILFYFALHLYYFRISQETIGPSMMLAGAFFISLIISYKRKRKNDN